jgi:tryptophanyl-tRNA synthetase
MVLVQTKEEKETDSHGACLGLLGYPALQAADILLFKWVSR